MILRHYSINCKNNIRDILHELNQLKYAYKNSNTTLYINSAYVNKDNHINLEIDEKNIEEILKIRDGQL